MSKRKWKIRHLNWLKLRNDSMDEYGEKLCYCGHTHTCTCGDPDLQTFKESVKNGTIKENDLDNGWISIGNHIY